MRSETTAFLFEQPALAPKIVEFPVIDDGDGFIRRLHRLVAARRRVNNRQSRHAERDTAVHHDAAIVRPAMAHRADHRADRRALDFATPYSADATHKPFKPPPAYPVERQAFYHAPRRRCRR